MVPTTPTRLLEDGDVIDLGDRKIEVIHVPGITPGTCGLLERESGTLLTGEALSYDNGHVYDGEPPDYTNDANPEAFKASLQRMLRLPVKRVYPGHYTCLDGARLAEIVADYLAGRTRSRFA
jgi:glyoxylase-like metal-dependent hydrolase (beta-lactamase superfamily II)